MINNIQFHGDWSKAGNRYTETDVKLLTNAKAQRRLCDKFDTCEHEMDVHFYKGPKSGWDTSLMGYQSADWVIEKYGIDIRPSDDKISLLITSNIGSPKYPLTPWIIAHRMSHAIWREVGYEHYQHIISSFHNLIGEPIFYNNSKWFGCAIGTMRSCRNRTLARTGELFHELFAQLLLSGRLNLRRIDNRVFTRNRWKTPEYKYFNDDTVERINRTIDRLENAVYSVEQHLHHTYGGVVVI